jgi:hypothetical protein
MSEPTRDEGAGARTADRDLVADLEGDLAGEHVDHLVTVVVQVISRLRARRCRFLKHHHAIAGLPAQEFERRRPTRCHLPYSSLTGRYDKTFCLDRSILRLRLKWDVVVEIIDRGACASRGAELRVVGSSSTTAAVTLVIYAFHRRPTGAAGTIEHRQLTAETVWHDVRKILIPIPQLDAIAPLLDLLKHRPSFPVEGCVRHVHNRMGHIGPDRRVHRQQDRQ